MRAYYSQYKKKYPKIEQKKARNGEYPCFYCGIKSQSIDHFIPQSFIDNIRLFLDISDTDDDIKNKICARQELIPSCLECNHIAHDGVFNTPNQKKEYIKAKLMKRYQGILQLPHWETEELDELGYILKNSVINAVDLKKLIIQRIAW